MLWMPSPEMLTAHGLEEPFTVKSVVPSLQLGFAAKPLSASAAATLTFTGDVLFQPAGLAECDRLMVGLVASYLKLYEADAVLPALSVQLRVTEAAPLSGPL